MIIKCSNCGKEISNKASVCPHCGEALYSNPIAINLKQWSKSVTIFGIIIAIICALLTFQFIENLGCVLVGILVYCMFELVALLLLAIAEVIQKLQNIENNVRK